MQLAENWDEIPGEFIDDPSAPDGKRFVSTKYGWRLTRVRISEQNQHFCEACGKRTYSGEAHHVYGRGMGGGKREDRPVVRGVKFLQWLCRQCHEAAVIVPWGAWKVEEN